MCIQFGVMSVPVSVSVGVGGGVHACLHVGMRSKYLYRTDDHILHSDCVHLRTWLNE